MIKKLLLAILLMVPAIFAGADNVRFTMSAPNVVTAGEQFRLSFTLNEEGSDLKLPDLSGFEILMGPSTSQSTSIQIINGRTTQEVSFSYIFILRAKQEGTFTIQPGSIKVDGKTYESNSLKIEVAKGQAPQQGAAAGSQQQQQSQASAPAEINKDDLFVRTELNKTNVFKGEQIVATVKIYVSPNIPLTGFEDVKLPSFEGFWTQDIDIPGQITFNREVHNGKIYQVGILKKTLLFPQQSGRIRIEPFEISTLIKQQIRRQRSFFDDFFDNYRTVSARLISDPVTITVKDLPAQPDGFYGGVGSMSFSAKPDKTETRSNEAVTFRITVNGSGNLRLIEAPKVDFPADFEVYDPKATDNLSVTSSGMSGTKTFEYLFIPRNQGDFVIPPVKFTWFNPANGQYASQTSPEYNIHVEKGDDSQNTTVTSAYTKEDVKYLGKDIRYIKQDKYHLRPKSALFFGSTAYWLTNMGALLAFVVIAVVYRKKLRENANIQLVRTKKANKVARRRLKEAYAYMKQKKEGEFHEAILKAYWGYLSDKLNIPLADLNREKATATLSAKKVSQEVITDFISLLDTCEFARYAPSAAGETPEELYNKAATLMGKLENQIR